MAKVRINVEDVNDNTPICGKTNYVFYAEETPYNNTEIGQVKASDADKVADLLDFKYPNIAFKRPGFPCVILVEKFNEHPPILHRIN